MEAKTNVRPYMKGGINMAILHNIYFSAKGTTRTCAECIGTNLHMEMESYNWCSPAPAALPEISGEDVLLFSMPVYGGFIPKMCVDLAAGLKGDGTPAIIAAVYGNRHYDDALLQMKDLLEERGFRVIAAGAFLAEHSIFPAVAAGRPDDRDRAAMEAFAAKCAQLLERGDFSQYGEIELPGTPGYDASAFKGVPLKPDGDKSCVACGTCVTVCPRHAIDPESPAKTDAKLCISCGACINACPTGARNYHGIAYKTAELPFKKKCSVYRQPEAYYLSEKTAGGL